MPGCRRVGLEVGGVTMTWSQATIDLLWGNAWTVIPLAFVVAAVCRWFPCRPATRHALWVLVLLGFVTPLVVPPRTGPLVPDVVAKLTLPAFGPSGPVTSSKPDEDESVNNIVRNMIKANTARIRSNTFSTG